MEFFTTPERYLEIFKKNQSVSSDLTAKYLESFEKINQIYTDYCKTSMDNINIVGSQLVKVKEPKDISTITNSQITFVKEETTDYYEAILKVNSKLVKDSTETAEINSLEFNKHFSDAVAEFSKNAPAGSEGIVEMTKSSIAASSFTYDLMTNVAKQVFENFEKNVDTASKVSTNEKSVFVKPSTKSSRNRKAA
jgi:hypothetical protein